MRGAGWRYLLCLRMQHAVLLAKDCVDFEDNLPGFCRPHARQGQHRRLARTSASAKTKAA